MKDPHPYPLRENLIWPSLLLFFLSYIFLSFYRGIVGVHRMRFVLIRAGHCLYSLIIYAVHATFSLYVIAAIDSLIYDENDFLLLKKSEIKCEVSLLCTLLTYLSLTFLPTSVYFIHSKSWPMLTSFSEFHVLLNIFKVHN